MDRTGERPKLGETSPARHRANRCFTGQHALCGDLRCTAYPAERPQFSIADAAGKRGYTSRRCRHCAGKIALSTGHGMAERRLRVLAIGQQPAQYQAPLFRRMAARSDLELQVAYCILRGAQAAHDPELGATVQWDAPLLDGYSWVQVANRGSGRESFWGLQNSGVLQMFNPASTSIFYSILGMKLYFYYVPLFLLGYAFMNSEADLRRFFHVNLG